MIGPYKKSEYPMKAIIQLGILPYNEKEINWKEICETTIDYVKYKDGSEWLECDYGEYCEYDEENECFFIYKGGMNIIADEHCIRILTDKLSENISELFNERMEKVKLEYNLLNKLSKK